jgi:hypothetical protein
VGKKYTETIYTFAVCTSYRPLETLR